MSVVPASRYLDTLLGGRLHVRASPLAWFNDLRAHAVDRVGALTVPTLRDEDWRFTDISPLTKIPFQPAHGEAHAGASKLAPFTFPEATARLVFIDGVYAPLYSLNKSGVVVESLATGIAHHTAAVEPHLGRHAGFNDNAFAALNTAFLHDGALVMVPRNVSVTAPIHLLFIATQPETANYPRCLVIAESGSEFTLVEDYATLNGGNYFTNAVSEIVLGDNARACHVRIQRESLEAFHIANCAVSMAHASCYRSVSVNLGGRISRHNLNVMQVAQGTDCAIDGLTLIGGKQLADTHTCIDHLQPHGVSRQLHKCIVGEAAHAVFNGKIMVRPGAQRTDSSQSSRNLLLSARARVDTKPQLEIFADDVKCAHGATVGELDSEAVFYLCSRGLSDALARNLLTYAFGAEILQRIPVTSLRQVLEQRVLAQTSQ